MADKQIGYKQAEAIRIIILDAVREVLKNDGLEISMGKCTFSPNHMDVKLKIVLPTSTVTADENERLSRVLGFAHNIIGKKVMVSGRRSPLEITGIKLSRPKYPIKAISVRGARYKLPVSAVQNGRFV